MTSTGRHLDETQAGIPNAPSERADLYGQSYCERHQGQQPKGRTQRPDIWAHRSRMGSAKKESVLDRGVVPHMGIPSESAFLRFGIIGDFASSESRARRPSRDNASCAEKSRTVRARLFSSSDRKKIIQCGFGRHASARPLRLGRQGRCTLRGVA
jgi:hypothetical protein